MDKSCYIIVGSGKSTEMLKNEILKNPLVLCGNNMKEKSSDKYLDDILSCRGLASLAHETIMDRYSQVFASIIYKDTVVQRHDCARLP